MPDLLGPSVVGKKKYNQLSISQRIAVEHELGKRGTEYQAEVLRLQRAQSEMPLREMSARSESVSAYSGAVRTGISLADWAAPIIGFALLLFFLLGPSLSAIMTIFSSINIFIWLGFIVVGIAFWKTSRRK